MKAGDTVKPSGYSIKPKQEYWLSCGRPAQKSAAKTALDEHIAKRGVIESVTQSGIVVKWNDGTASYCLPYLVEEA